MSEKVWFITGTSRGFGREWAEAALQRGDKVAATARNTASLDDLEEKYRDALLPIRLDVTDRDADFAAVKQAHDHFGRIDIVVNNAGYGQFGFVEEVSEQEARDQIETNVFGALWVTQAALPYLREQRSGHIIQVSSIGGIVAFPLVGLYHASKWALEGFSQALAQEVAPFGVHVTLIEPGGFDTDWAGPSAKHADPLPAYDELRAAVNAERQHRWAAPGDPAASAAALLKVVDAEEPPLRVFFGAVPARNSPRPTTKTGYAPGSSGSRLQSWRRDNLLTLSPAPLRDARSAAGRKHRLVMTQQLVTDDWPAAPEHAAPSGQCVAGSFVEQVRDGGGQLRLEVVDSQQQAGAPRCHQVTWPTGIGGDHRQAGRQRFLHDLAERLVLAGVHEDVHAGIGGGEFLAV